MRAAVLQDEDELLNDLRAFPGAARCGLIGGLLDEREVVDGRRCTRGAARAPRRCGAGLHDRGRRIGDLLHERQLAGPLLVAATVHEPVLEDVLADIRFDVSVCPTRGFVRAWTGQRRVFLR